MEKYQGRLTMASKSNEKVYLVNTSDMYQDSCILKLLECIDHPHATGLMSDLNKINSVHHHLILGYRDLFLHWDSTDSALYIAVVADYQKGGSLEQYVTNQFGKPVSEETIRRWTAQLIDSVITIHSHDDLSHNNVKLSNVYIGEGDNAVLGDALPINALLYRKNRKAGNDKNAPKPASTIGAFEDIRGIGRIAMALTSPAASSIYGHVYTTDFLESIQALIDAKESLLKIASDNQYLKRSLQSIGSRHVPPLPLHTWPHARIRVPVELGVPGILSYMDSHRSYSDCLQAALNELARIFAQTPHSLASVDAPLLLSILDSAAASPEVQTTTFTFLTRLRYSVEPSLFVRLLSDNLISYATRIIGINENFPDVITSVADFFSALAEDSRIAHRLISNGIVLILVDTLRAQLAKKHPDVATVSTALCQTIFRLSAADNLASVALQSGALVPMTDCLKIENMRLKRCALAAMVGLAMEPEGPKSFLSSGAFETVSLTLCHYYDDSEVTQLSCTILASLIAASAECALSMLLLPVGELGEEGSGLLDIVLAAYRTHADHGSVVEACAQLMAAFSFHPEVVVEFANCHLGKETVDEIARRYRDRITIVEACKLMQTALQTYAPATLATKSTNNDSNNNNNNQVQVAA